MLYLEFLFLLLMLYTGSRYGGVGLGVVSGIGLVVEVFVLRMPPTSPPHYRHADYPCCGNLCLSAGSGRRPEVHASGGRKDSA